jgi:hypothetical protein
MVGWLIAKRKWGTVKTTAAIRWNDPQRPWARESFGAVPAIASVGGGGSILVGSHPGEVATKPTSSAFSAVSRAEISRSACYDRASMASGDNRH